MNDDGGRPASLAGRIDGVLFDIDDTLVDLETAMDKTLRHVSAEHAPGLAESEWVEYTRLYSKDPLGHYDRFLSGAELRGAASRAHPACAEAGPRHVAGL
ncbi:hypothetical protein GCM10027562_29780 [Arthrobacter pigmenti]